METRFTRLAVMALAMIIAVPAWATLQLDIGGDVTAGVYTPGTIYTDGGAGDLLPGVVGNLLVAAGGITFNISTANGISGSPIASLTLSTNGVPLTAPQTVKLLISDNNFNLPPTPLFLTQTANLLAASDGPVATVTGVGYFGDSNLNFDVNGPSTGTATGSVNIPPGTSTSVGATSGTILNPTPYSLTSFVTVNISELATGTNPNLQIQANLSASPIPEPASVVFFGTALLSVSALLRKKLKQS